tara:strand:+ start:108 stop:278 length:171 start_codon:yes stop_codon:yes gene_type:complete
MPARVITYAIDDEDIEIPAHLDLCKKCVEKHELQFQKGLLEGRFDVTSNCGEKSKV